MSEKEYVPAPWLLGHGARFRMTSAAAAGRSGPWACPAKTAHGARLMANSVTVADRSGWRRRWDDSERLNFSVLPAMRAVAGGLSIAEAAAAEPALTPPQRRFLEHALHELADLPDLACDSAGAVLELAERSYYSGDEWGEIYSTGPEFASADGAVRESVRTRLKAVKGLRLPTGEPSDEALDFVAVAAFVLTRANPGASRIRVSEFSLHTGAYEVLFDGDPARARAMYAERGRPVVQALAGTAVRPGSQCGTCDMVTMCPAPTKLDGALGLPEPAVALRAVTSTDLSAYDFCPTKFHAQRRSHLPARPRERGAVENTAARDRGIAVHALLKLAHSGRATGCLAAGPDGCSAASWPALPEPGEPLPDGLDELLGAARVSVEQYAVARPYLLSHVEHCLLGFAGLGNVQVEPRHVAYDADADVVLVAEPDLTLRSGTAGPVWRETKTTTRLLPASAQEALNAYPAFAFNVALLAAGIEGNAREDGVAELEVLAPAHIDEGGAVQGRGAVFVVSLAEGPLVALAQRLVAGIARAWSQDLRFEPRPSTACETCPVYGWCLPPEVAVPPQREADDREFLGVPDPF